MEINREEFKKWIEALRSGKYKQGRDRLQSDVNSYCCLGVACIVLIPQDKLFLSPSVLPDGSTYAKLYGVYPGAQTHAPRWLKDINDDFKAKTGIALSDRNDNDNWSFTQIADDVS